MKKINIKKGAIALAFITTIALTTPACASISDISYEKNASGYIDSIEGTVSYSVLEDCYFVRVNNKITDEVYYTMMLHKADSVSFVCFDIFTRQVIAGNEKTKEIFDVETCDEVTDWLRALNMVKDEYTEEDLREILNIFIEKQEKDKQLVKE